ncbi:ATP-binding protein [Pseudoalteromonas rubra]|uniref:ATP-binding protein n=1 Tax=Pseudoalteromonas rubra TaxID=43658 RepID=UPI002DBE23D4|nr:ATP-binding protein [Pseudoalteromonas rubra]MEC4088233.1 ATP-binding protein [Pseudoalteromonas rubra]
MSLHPVHRPISINRKLTLILVSCLILSTFWALLSGYQASMEKAEQQLDEQLREMATLLLETELTQTIPTQEIYFQIWQHGVLLAASERLSSTESRVDLSSGWQTQNIAAMRLRTYVIERRERVVLVAEPVNKRFSLAESLVLSAMMPLVIIMPILAVFIAWYIYRALRPLTQLSSELKVRRADDFTALNTFSQDREVAPVIAMMNALFAKVEAAYLRERYFASDAAHELKTPIAALKIHLHNLAGGPTESSLKGITQSAEQLNHIVEQMLTLARTEPQVWRRQFDPIDTEAVTQQLVAQMYDKIADKAQLISLHSEPHSILGCQFTLSTLLGNLLSNAIKYTPPQGEIRIDITRNAHQVLWQIQDSGPGMTQAQIDRVFDRFYRVGGDSHPSGEKGAGLGMAIVRQICEIYDATLTLSDSELGGLKVSLAFKGAQNE